MYFKTIKSVLNVYHLYLNLYERKETCYVTNPNRKYARNIPVIIDLI